MTATLEYTQHVLYNHTNDTVMSSLKQIHVIQKLI